ncbi:MAG: LUD domain-containing protein [Pseudomonadota bacterium]
MSAARDDILNRVKKALAGGPPPNPRRLPPEPNRETRSREELKREFSERWVNLGGRLRLAGSPRDLEEIIREISREYPGPAAVATSALDVAPDLKGILEKLNLEVWSAHPDQARDAAFGLTGAFLAMAYSGSLAVRSDPPGELSASLVPPVHAALVPVDRLIYGPTEAIRRLGASGWPRAASFITGPSRTADIELNLVMGVHGPGQTYAVLLDF